MRILPAVVQIGFCACCGATEGGIIHGNVSVSGATVGRIIHGNLCREPQATIGEEPTQHGRDGFFPVVRIFSSLPMADAVVVVTIFQQHFPSMLAMCSAMVKVILASSPCSMRDRSDSHCLFIFSSLRGFDLGVIGNHKTDDHCDL